MVVGNVVAAGMLAAYMGIFLILELALYIYSSLAFMYIGRKAKVKYPGLSWIPGIGPILVAYFAAKGKSTPWWILLGSVIAYFLGVILIFVGAFVPALLVIGDIIMIAVLIGFIYFAVYEYIWLWKMFEAVKKPGWWGIIPLFAIPFAFLLLIPALIIPIFLLVLLIIIWFFVMVGIAAWSN